MTCDRLERDDLLGHLGEQMDPHVEDCPDCRARRRDYSRLTTALAAESYHPLPERWKERTLARIQYETRRPRRTTATVGIAVAAVVAVVLIVVGLPGRERPQRRTELAVRIEKGKTQWRAAAGPRSANRGDILHVTSPGLAGDFELRVYHDGRRVAVRCPGHPAPTCRQTRDAVELTWKLTQTGAYQVVWLASASPLPPPTDNLDDDLDAARRAGARISEGEPIDVD